MKIKELKEKNEEELNKILKETKEEIRDFMFKISKGKIKNVKLKREARKNIARILTLLNIKSKK